jgi:hypothetical protein
MSATTQPRPDLHNISVYCVAAAEGLCGFTHMTTGRVCRLPLRHAGACDPRPRRHPPGAAQTKPRPLKTESNLPNPKEP